MGVENSGNGWYEFRTRATSGNTLPEMVLLLAPSRGLGGGIERYGEAIEYAFREQGIEYYRLDLRCPGAAAHLRLLKESRQVLDRSVKPTRIVLLHRALLPVASILAQRESTSGISVVCHGTDAWGMQSWIRCRIEQHLMRKAGVRVVAVSSFTAGALTSICPATVLVPGLSKDWFSILVSASESSQKQDRRVHLVTAFRLVDWVDKGLPQVLEAIDALRRTDVSLTVCGSGEPTKELLEAVAGHSWCTLKLD